jgi:hypothetical protein
MSVPDRKPPASQLKKIFSSLEWVPFIKVNSSATRLSENEIKAMISNGPFIAVNILHVNDSRWRCDEISFAIRHQFPTTRAIPRSLTG